MKIVIVCDDLIQWGGAEKVFLDVLNLYPDALVYTSTISNKWRDKLNSMNVKYHVSFLQKFPFINKLYRFYSIFYLHIIAFESFDFSQFDVVISMSSRYAHFIITKPTTKHICYMHSPARMFWDTEAYFKSEFWRKLLFVIKPFLFFARISDYVAAQRVDEFIANSKVTHDRIKKYYQRESEIINPSIDISKFFMSEKISDYYLVLTRLISWKRVDLVIEAFNKTSLKLKIIGNGPDLTRLKHLAMGNSNIEILTNIDDDTKLKYLSECKALINPQFEDFGIVPLEAMASGRPVIAFRKGGALETVVEGKTGMFFDIQNFDSLLNTLKKFEEINIKPQDCYSRACKFDKKYFESKLLKLVNNV